MKRIIRICYIALTTLLPLQELMAQESVSVRIRENGVERTDTIDLPKSMTYPLDSLLVDWKAKNYISVNQECSTSA